MGYIPYILENDKLLKYDINNFPEILCTDFLLLKDIPQNLKVNLIQEYVQDSNKVITYIIQNLSKDYNGVNIHFISSICYALKDFPEYISNTQITELLKEISKKNIQDKYINKCLGWFIKKYI